MKEKSEMNPFPPASGDDRRTRPISGILQEIIAHLTEIIHSEIRLARAELRRDATQVVRASVVLVAGGVFGAYAFGFLLLAIVYALGESIPPWAAALIVAAGLAVLGIALFIVGRKKMQAANLVPEETIHTLKENLTWVKTQTR